MRTQGRIKVTASQGRMQAQHLPLDAHISQTASLVNAPSSNDESSYAGTAPHSHTRGTTLDQHDRIGYRRQ